MRRFATLFAAGILVSLGLHTASYGQFLQQFQQERRGGSSDMIGSTVYDRNGDNIGTLSQIVTDPRSGQPLYGIISSGGIFGFGAAEHPVPWQMFTSNPHGMRVDLTRDRLRNAPGFTAGNRPDLLNPSWQRRIGDYYGVQPLAGGAGYGGSQGFGQGGFLYQDLFDRGSIQRFSGTVDRVFHHTQGDQMQVLLRADDGRRLMVALAPEWYLENYNAEPRQGDRMTVRGSLVSFRDRPFVIATRVRTENQTLRLRTNDGVPMWIQEQSQQQGDYGRQNYGGPGYGGQSQYGR